MTSRAGVNTQCCGCGIPSWTGSVVLVLILLRRRRYQTQGMVDMTSLRDYTDSKIGKTDRGCTRVPRRNHWDVPGYDDDNVSISSGVFPHRSRGARHGKLEAQKEHFMAHNARKRCFKMKFDGIHDRFQRDSENRDSQLKIGWIEEKCIEMDKLAQEEHSYCPSSEEFEKKNCNIALNKSGRNAPMKLRSDFREAVTIVNRLHREFGEERPEPILFHQYQRWHSLSSSSSSWWQWNEHWSS